jgi:CxxC motif-containing protein
MKKDMICINCPRGCRLTVSSADNATFDVAGNFCPRGRTYGIQEATDPRRTVTAVVPAADPALCCAPVRSSAPVPVKMIPDLLNELYQMRLTEPALRGTSLISNWRGTGIDIIFTSDFPAPM